MHSNGAVSKVARHEPDKSSLGSMHPMFAVPSQDIVYHVMRATVMVGHHKNSCVQIEYGTGRAHVVTASCESTCEAGAKSA